MAEAVYKKTAIGTSSKKKNGSFLRVDNYESALNFLLK